MRDVTNLQWPEAPFGAGHRPYGRREDLLTAVVVDRATPDGQPVSVAVVYLRLAARRRVREVDPDRFDAGFRVTAADRPGDVPDLLGVLDRTLLRARRHAAVLTGHDLGGTLAGIRAGSTRPLRGIDGLLDAWADRDSRTRGTALIVDAVDVLPTPVPDTAEPVRSSLTRCLATGLAVAAHIGRYAWAGTFPVAEVVDRIGWDVLPTSPDPPVSTHG